MENTRVLMGIANHLKIPFRTNHRCRDHPQHFEYLLSLRDAGPYEPDYSRFPVDLSVLPDLAICQNHRSRLMMNALMMERSGVFFPKPAKWSGPEPQDLWVRSGMPFIGTRRQNGLWYTVAAVSDESVTFTDGTIVTASAFVRDFRVAYAVTCHAIQGKTIRDQRVWMLDAHMPHCTKAHYLVAASRCSDPRNFGMVTPGQQRLLMERAARLGR
jgi:hypothetical protein